MVISDTRTSAYRRPLAALAALALLTWAVIPAGVLAQPGDDAGGDAGEEISTVWDRIAELRLRGDYEAAIDMLEEVIREHADTDQILRHAYNHLIFTLILMRDDARAEAKAEEALGRFPDLHAPPPAFPDRMNTTYERLRRRMYGALQITTDPDESRVFLNGAYRGTTPLNIPFIRTGDYDLLISQTGYEDHVGSLVIGPNQTLTQDISLDKHRGTGWWLMRIGAGAVVGTAIALIANSGGTESPQPLPGPPDPPTR